MPRIKITAVHLYILFWLVCNSLTEKIRVKVTKPDQAQKWNAPQMMNGWADHVQTWTWWKCPNHVQPHYWESARLKSRRSSSVLSVCAAWTYNNWTRQSDRCSSLVCWFSKARVTRMPFEAKRSKVKVSGLKLNINGACGKLT